MPSYPSSNDTDVNTVFPKWRVALVLRGITMLLAVQVIWCFGVLVKLESINDGFLDWEWSNSYLKGFAILPVSQPFQACVASTRIANMMTVADHTLGLFSPDMGDGSHAVCAYDQKTSASSRGRRHGFDHRATLHRTSRLLLIHIWAIAMDTMGRCNMARAGRTGWSDSYHHLKVSHINRSGQRSQLTHTQERCILDYTSGVFDE